MRVKVDKDFSYVKFMQLEMGLFPYNFLRNDVRHFLLLDQLKKVPLHAPIMYIAFQSKHKNMSKGRFPLGGVFRQELFFLFSFDRQLIFRCRFSTGRNFPPGPTFFFV